jgi:hypothetical protein
MPQQSKPQRETVGRVMHEFKEGELETSRGAPVRSRRRAVAIALHEAGTARDASPAANRHALARTRRREAAADETRATLYAEASRRGIRGRARMTKAELVRALRG